MDSASLAARIDHTALKPEVGAEDIARVCEEARRAGFATVCVAPRWVETAAAALEGTPVGVCTVVGFPLGQAPPELLDAETRWAVARGADEIDMVLAWGELLRGELDFCRSQIAAVVAAAAGRCVKVILESASLDAAALRRGCALAVEGGASFVKTSTGFGAGGASLGAVELMREVVGPDFGVKASGGIRTRAQAEAMIAAGADRLGCSASMAIVGEAQNC